MSLLKTVLERHAMAAAAFVKWLVSRETLSPYLPYIKQGFEKMPVEMVYGVLLLFFRDQGLVLSSRVTPRGTIRTRIFIRRTTGTYREAFVTKWRGAGEPAMELAIAASFRILERKLEHALPQPNEDEHTKVVIGLDIDAILAEAERRKQLA